MFKALSYLVLIFLLFLFGTSNVSAQAGTVNITVNLNFGQIAYKSSQGSVTIGIDNSKTAINVINTGSYTRGTIRYTAPNKKKRITSVSLVSATSPHTNLSFTGFTSSFVSNVDVLARGFSDFYFGGTLYINGPVPAGSYSITLSINIVASNI